MHYSLRLPHYMSIMRGYIDQNRKEFILFAVSILILMGLSILSIAITSQSFEADRAIEELDRYNTRVNNFSRILRTIESSQRGFIITNSKDFLVPYTENSSKIMSLWEEIQNTFPKEINIEPKFAAITDWLKAKLTEMQETITSASAGNQSAAIERIKEGYGKSLTQNIENQSSYIQDKTNGLIRLKRDNTLRLQTIKLFVDTGGAILIVVFSFLSLFFIMRSNAGMHEAQAALTKSNLELEDIVEERTSALKRANEEIQRFAYIVSHDLRSPLVNIMGFTSELEVLRKQLFAKMTEAGSLAQSSVETLGNDFDEAFGFIKSSIARMDRLINAILRISREGNRPLNPEVLNMSELIEGIFSGLEHQVREKQARIEIEPLPPLIADRLAIEQIFSNLIENAIKFLPATEEGVIEVKGEDLGFEVVYTIKDNGRGVDARDHQRIFELFRRSGPQNVPGEGMGLAYVAAFIRRLGGMITLDSELNRGSTFKLTIPKAALLAK